MKAEKRRKLVQFSREQFGLSIRRACSLMLIAESSFRYRSCKSRQEALRMRLRELAASRPRYGYRRLHVLLEREGWAINHKRVARLYREEGLAVRTKRRRKTACQSRLELPGATAPDERWSLDFVSDALVDGSQLRILTVVDQFTRECVALHAGHSIPAVAVTRVLEAGLALDPVS